jgi:hypothetical protein
MLQMSTVDRMSGDTTPEAMAKQVEVLRLMIGDDLFRKAFGGGQVRP